jgi:hypothetical protein
MKRMMTISLLMILLLTCPLLLILQPSTLMRLMKRTRAHVEPTNSSPLPL